MEGVINVLKPPGMTSSNVVADVKRICKEKRVGHTGTLDPGAAGVLPICISRATRLFDLLVDKEKEYIAEISFGICTDTQDSYGSIIEKNGQPVTKEEFCAVLPRFLGRQKQTAPAYSALKVHGQPMHEIARHGGEVPEKIREIEIHALEFIREKAPGKILFRVRCSRGTYVRTLCEDIGRALHTCAYLSFLLRTATGPFVVEDSYTIDELAELAQMDALEKAVQPVEMVLAYLPAVCVEETTVPS